MPILLIILLAVIALFVVGSLVIGLTLKLLGLAIVGLIIGAVARLVLPGEQQIGLLATALFGIAGSLTGGIVGDLLGVGGILQFVLGVVAAAIFITVYEGGLRRRTA